MMNRRNFFPVVIILVLLSAAPITLAQTDCGVADSISYPIEPTVFTLAQDFAIASPRHQGRFHTGEDWYGGRGTSIGQPVRAAARGRVTYAYSLGWGRDGGVIIIEHRFPDGTIAYTQYGHIAESETVVFPQVLTCVEAGQVIAVIGDARPAPHLHFEVRVAQPDIPGPGYSWEAPQSLGWRDPGKFVTNMQTWLRRAHRWHVLMDDDQNMTAPPLVLNDNSILYLDGNTLKRATNDGRVMWRVGLERQAVSITGLQGVPLLAYADGTMQVMTIDGGMGDNWQLDASLAGAPLVAGNLLIYPTTDQGLVALNEDRREILWRLENVPPFVRWHVAGNETQFVIGLITTDNEILTISRNGELIDRALLRDTGSLTTAPDGTLIAYTRGGLWRIDGEGNWSLLLEDTPPGGGSSAVHITEDGHIILFDSSQVYAYSPTGEILWQVELPGVSGLAELSSLGTTLLLTSNHGNIISLRNSGSICSRVQVDGGDGAGAWHDLGADGILRVSIADQILGLDWEQFGASC